MAKNQVAEIEVSYRPSISNKPLIKSVYDAFSCLKEFFPTKTISLQERFVVMYLNRANRILGVHVLSTGGIVATVVDIRLLLSIALKTAATSIILSHNHPSGNLHPSENDKLLTQKIKEACKLLDIRLLDHLIITPELNYLSMQDEGLI